MSDRRVRAYDTGQSVSGSQNLKEFAVSETRLVTHNRAMPDLNEIQRICGLLDRGEIDRIQFFEQFTQQLTAEIGCSRAGVRMLITAPNGEALRCAAMFEVARAGLVKLPDMNGADMKPYFQTLLRDGCVVAPDVRSHPATAGMLDEYLLPLGVRSLMDVCFSVNGVLYGTFSCEQVGSTLEWTPRQLRMLRHIASRASLTLMHAITSQVDTAPGALWEPSTPNRLMTMPMPLDLGED